MREDNPTDPEYLFTMDDISPLHINLIPRGVGLWTFYVINELYLKGRLDGRARMISIGSRATLESLIACIERRRVRYIIPLDCTDAEFISEHLPSLQKRCGPIRALVSEDRSWHATLENKWRTARFCQHVGIPIPRTVALAPTDTDLPFLPAYIKIASGTNGGRGVAYVSTATQAAATIASWAKAGHREFVAQQPVTGTVIVIQTVLYRGRVQVMVMWRRAFEGGLVRRYMFPATHQGPSYVCIAPHLQDRVAAFVQSISERTNYTGPLDVEIIAAEDGRLMLLEFNPRFSGGLQNAIGSPVMDVYWSLLHGGAALPRNQRAPYFSTVTPLVGTGVIRYYCQRMHLIPRVPLGGSDNPSTRIVILCIIALVLVVAFQVWRRQRGPAS